MADLHRVVADIERVDDDEDLQSAVDDIQRVDDDIHMVLVQHVSADKHKHTKHFSQTSKCYLQTFSLVAVRLTCLYSNRTK